MVFKRGGVFKKKQNSLVEEIWQIVIIMNLPCQCFQIPLRHLSVWDECYNLPWSLPVDCSYVWWICLPIGLNINGELSLSVGYWEKWQILWIYYQNLPWLVCRSAQNDHVINANDASSLCLSTMPSWCYMVHLVLISLHFVVVACYDLMVCISEANVLWVWSHI